MPFATDGVYTPPTGAVSASPGALIQSSVWNAIFTDLSAALTLLGQQNFAEPVTYTGTTGTLLAGPSIINASGAFIATLPAAAANPSVWLFIKSVASQTITSASSNVIPLAGGAAGTALLSNTAGKWAFLLSDGTDWNIMASN